MQFVIPANAGIQQKLKLGSRFRGNDDNGGMALLSPHPAYPPKAQFRVELSLLREGDAFQLDTALIGDIDAVRFAETETPCRRDGLWQTTCFEAFLKPEGAEQYFEVNYAQHGDWAAYRFGHYRADMRNAAIEPSGPPYAFNDEKLEQVEQRFSINEIELSAAPAWLLGLSAVIEELDGTKSYWALAHPSETPDFHHPDCFVARLP